MKERDILGGHTYCDPLRYFQVGQDPQPPMIYAYGSDDIEWPWKARRKGPIFRRISVSTSYRLTQN